uniref:Protease n=1 Tax=viral metagenome TaxID=1070528 RepID=A0A6C0L005_9ZZZZ
MRIINLLFLTNLLKISYAFNKPMLDKPEAPKPVEARPTAKPLTIRFHTPVTSDSCSKLAEALVQMDIQSKQLEASFGQRMPVKLHLQSLGGELLPTFYICDLIQNLDTPVHVYIDGFVASAASLMAICGEKRFMTKNSCVLVHQLRAVSSGKLSDMKQEIDNLNNFMGSLRQIYLENSNVKEEELDDLLTSELWLDSEKCLELGFVDEILGC